MPKETQMGPNALAIFREFPFLEKIFLGERILNVCVKRIDEKLLSMEAHELLCGDGDGSLFADRTIKVLDSNGQTLARVGCVEIEKRFLGFTVRWTSRRYEDRCETIADALDRVPDQSKIGYVAVLDEHQTLTLYKPPTGFTVCGWYEKLISEKQNRLREQSTKIDAESAH